MDAFRHGQTRLELGPTWSGRYIMGKNFHEFYDIPAAKVTSYIQEKGIRLLDENVHLLLTKYREGKSIKDEKFCLLHTIFQLVNNSEEIEKSNYKSIQKVIGYSERTNEKRRNKFGLLQADKIAEKLNLLVYVWAIDKHGCLRMQCTIGNKKGRMVDILRYDNHYVPLWPRVN